MKLMVCIPLLLCSIVWVQESLRLERGALSVVVEVGSYAEEQEFGPRFDRAGVVRSLRVHGREWLGPWGLVDEFGLSVAAHATMRFTGDFQPYRFALFADPRGFCPEIFFRAKLKPGTTITWSASYHFP